MRIVRTIVNGDDRVIVKIEGRLDTLTAPELEQYLDPLYDEAPGMVLDLTDLEYISSAGLRVLLKSHKIMAQHGGLKVTNPNEAVAEIFEITGFDSVFDIE